MYRKEENSEPGHQSRTRPRTRLTLESGGEVVVPQGSRERRTNNKQRSEDCEHVKRRGEKRAASLTQSEEGKKLRARTPEQNPAQDQTNLESGGEVVVPQGSRERRTNNKQRSQYMERLNSIYDVQGRVNLCRGPGQTPTRGPALLLKSNR
ncbi:hypothetical protein D5F01_LYC01613 [Larimichthys crocea]|uniref:Uncharacterized protein n=1 Tax=Larimichthys crocea TaxID=215358 RepID=A0A6G0J687_LARCR|nr:hypothetical protein D5F01_LYC01613 [Larimichthys crocea]